MNVIKEMLWKSHTIENRVAKVLAQAWMEEKFFKSISFYRIKHELNKEASILTKKSTYLTNAKMEIGGENSIFNIP
jgi:hypothetical protein